MLTPEDRRDAFIRKAQEVHKDENLDYSEVEYVNNRTPVKIIDHDLDENGNEYGEFWQTPSNHLKGQMHPAKRNKRISDGVKCTQEEVIERFKKVHQNEDLDYSKVVYTGMHDKVLIIDHGLDKNGEEYGEFWQEPVVHLKGCGHPRRAIEKNADRCRYDTEEFVRKAKLVHADDDYDYSNVEYVNSRTKVEVICRKVGSNGKEHGPFMTSPDLFLQGKGCPKCGNRLSYAEDEIAEFIEDLLGKGSVVRHDTMILEGKELDIYVPKYGFAVEFNGLKWHTEEFGKDKDYHLKKTLGCNRYGITLFQVFEDEWRKNKRLVFDKIQNALGVEKRRKMRVYGRCCEVHLISKRMAEQFLERNHMQGFASATEYVGAFWNGFIVGAMCFKKEHDDGCWELNRCATDIDYVCCGVTGKMFKWFVRRYNPVLIKSFLDIRWMDIGKANIYEILGFRNDGRVGPDYKYTDGNCDRMHKFGFRKQVLHRKYGLPLTMTEKEMVEKLGYYRVWDCGLVRYVWKKELNNKS